MFEQIFGKDYLVQRHRSAPFASEREAFLGKMVAARYAPEIVQAAARVLFDAAIYYGRHGSLPGTFKEIEDCYEAVIKDATAYRWEFLFEVLGHPDQHGSHTDNHPEKITLRQARLRSANHTTECANP